MFKNIAVAYEDIPQGRHALARAIELSGKLGSPLTILTIADPMPAYMAFTAAAGSTAMQVLEQDRTEFYEEQKQRLIDEGQKHGVAVSAYILDGNRVQAIVDFVTTNEIDLLVVGLHRHSLRMSSLWSTVYSLAQELSCSVLGVH